MATVIERAEVTERTAGKGDIMGDAERIVAMKRGNGRVHGRSVADADIDSLCASLQSLERQRRFALKQCVRGENAITAFVAWNACGFHTGLPTEAEREKLWKKATKLIKQIDVGDVDLDTEIKDATQDESTVDTDAPCVQDDEIHDTDTQVVQDEEGGANSRDTDLEAAAAYSASDDTEIDSDTRGVAGVVRISQIARKAWADYEAALMKEMGRLAGELPVSEWLVTDECRGISVGMLATIVGEAGNLSNYPNPAKLWKRLFGAPIEKNGKVMMPSRWRLEKGLTAEEWEEAGYSPQRHATMQQLKENIVRQNGDGPYRKRYDEAKERTRETHPEWWQCSKCEGSGKSGNRKCANCKGTGEVALHAHRHAQLLAAKRFVRDLWNRWHGIGADVE